jgi:hypothetical protein
MMSSFLLVVVLLFWAWLLVDSVLWWAAIGRLNDRIDRLYAAAVRDREAS